MMKFRVERSKAIVEVVEVEIGTPMKLLKFSADDLTSFENKVIELADTMLNGELVPLPFHVTRVDVENDGNPKYKVFAL